MDNACKLRAYKNHVPKRHLDIIAQLRSQVEKVSGITSMTTLLGLFPMGLGIGSKSRAWGPMANTIIWDLGFATISTLFFIPAFYAILDDLVEWLSKKEVPMG